MSVLASQFEGEAASGLVVVSDVFSVTNGKAGVGNGGPLDIQAYDRFTVYVRNDGGGGGDAITEVEIQTSPDLDDPNLWEKFDNGLVSPLAANTNAFRAFDATSLKFLRLRAKCAGGQNTTARIWVSVGGAG